MASEYPIELKTRVIEKTESGMKIVGASRLFNVHRETIANWIKIKKENSNCEAKK
jgi:transposase